MKKTLILALLIFMGCTNKLKVDDAKVVVESLIEEVKTKSPDDIPMNDYFSKEFMEQSLNIEKWKQHQKEAIDQLGAIQSYSLIEISHTTLNSYSAIELVYRYKHTESKSRNTFVLIKEQGHYRIKRYNIKMN